LEKVKISAFEPFRVTKLFICQFTKCQSNIVPTVVPFAFLRFLIFLSKCQNKNSEKTKSLEMRLSFNPDLGGFKDNMLCG